MGEAIVKSGIARTEIFLTTKVWVTDFADGMFQASVEESLKKLRTDHVDLLLLHWPGGSDVPMAERIERLNEVRAQGKTRHIGISNYNRAQMAEAAAQSEAPLVTNQVEYHPWLDQRLLLDEAQRLGMSLTAYYAMADGRAATDPVLADIGAAHGKTAAQVTLRWLIQHEGVVALSKTARAERLRENCEIFDFSLSDSEMEAIQALACPDGRISSPANLAPEWD